MRSIPKSLVSPSRSPRLVLYPGSSLLTLTPCPESSARLPCPTQCLRSPAPHPLPKFLCSIPLPCVPGLLAGAAPPSASVRNLLPQASSPVPAPALSGYRTHSHPAPAPGLLALRTRGIGGVCLGIESSWVTPTSYRETDAVAADRLPQSLSSPPTPVVFVSVLE